MCWLIIGESESHSYFISDDTLHSPTYLYSLKVSVLVSVVLDVHCTAVTSIHAHFLVHCNKSLPSAAESHSRGRSKVCLHEKSSVWHDTCTTCWTVNTSIDPKPIPALVSILLISRMVCPPWTEFFIDIYRIFTHYWLDPSPVLAPGCLCLGFVFQKEQWVQFK